MRKIAVVTGSRAEYGVLLPLLKGISEEEMLELSIVAVGVHLSPEFGETIHEIEEDNFVVDEKIDTLGDGDEMIDMAHYIGKTIIEFANIIKKKMPDIIVVTGDRAEMLAVTIAAAYMNVPIAHIHGGDASKAGLDEPARHSITKFSQIHFPATEKSAQRIIKLGEDPERVFTVGALALDNVLNGTLLRPEEVANKFNLDLSKPVVLMLQHPVTTESKEGYVHIKNTLEVLKELAYQTIVIYPSSDAGSRKMIEVIKSFDQEKLIGIYKSLNRIEYLSLMNVANVLVGNSSSGIIEAPSFHLPVVNIGIRQEGRERADNIIDVGYDKIEIKEAIKKALFDVDFINKVKTCKNPYGDGHTAGRIVNILKTIKIDKELLQKHMTY